MSLDAISAPRCHLGAVGSIRVLWVTRVSLGCPSGSQRAPRGPRVPLTVPWVSLIVPLVPLSLRVSLCPTGAPWVLWGRQASLPIPRCLLGVPTPHVLSVPLGGPEGPIGVAGPPPPPPPPIRRPPNVPKVPPRPPWVAVPPVSPTSPKSPVGSRCRGCPLGFAVAAVPHVPEVPEVSDVAVGQSKGWQLLVGGTQRVLVPKARPQPHRPEGQGTPQQPDLRGQRGGDRVGTGGQDGGQRDRGTG